MSTSTATGSQHGRESGQPPTSERVLLLALLILTASLIYGRLPAATQAATAAIAGGCSSAATAQATQATSITLEISPGQPMTDSGHTALSLILTGLLAASLGATSLVLAKLLFSSRPLIPSREAPAAGWGLAHVSLVAMAFVLLSITSGMVSGSTAQILTLQMATHTATACLALSLARRHGHQDAPMGDASHRARDAITGVVGYLATLPWFYGVAMLSLLTCAWLGLPMQRHPVEGLLLAPGTPPQVLIAASLLAVVVAPACEELLFRGFLLPALERQLPRTLSIAVSALVFASVHAGIHTLAPLFVLGCLLGWLFSKTRSLAAPVAAHVTHNGLTVLFASLATS